MSNAKRFDFGFHLPHALESPTILRPQDIEKFKRPFERLHCVKKISVETPGAIAKYTMASILLR